MSQTEGRVTFDKASIVGEVEEVDVGDSVAFEAGASWREIAMAVAGR